MNQGLLEEHCRMMFPCGTYPACLGSGAIVRVRWVHKVYTPAHSRESTTATKWKDGRETRRECHGMDGRGVIFQRPLLEKRFLKKSHFYDISTSCFNYLC